MIVEEYFQGIYPSCWWPRKCFLLIDVKKNELLWKNFFLFVGLGNFFILLGIRKSHLFWTTKHFLLGWLREVFLVFSLGRSNLFSKGIFFIELFLLISARKVNNSRRILLRIFIPCWHKEVFPLYCHKKVNYSEVTFPSCWPREVTTLSAYYEENFSSSC